MEISRSIRWPWPEWMQNKGPETAKNFSAARLSVAPRIERKSRQQRSLQKRPLGSVMPSFSDHAVEKTKFAFWRRDFDQVSSFADQVSQLAGKV